MLTSAPVIVVSLSLVLDLSVGAGDVLAHGGGHHGMLGVIPQPRQRHHVFTSDHNNTPELFNSFVSILSILMLLNFVVRSVRGWRTEAGVWSLVPGPDVTGLCWRSLSPLPAPVSPLFSEPL